MASRGISANTSESRVRKQVSSLSGLIDHREAQMIANDYEQSCQNPFANAPFAALQIQLNFEILELVSFGETRMGDLPSWAVDFTTNLEISTVDLHQLTYQTVVWKEPGRAVDSTVSVDYDE